MTQERFARIVEDPELLRTITYEELKTLALAYPYAHNLWYFLAIKARQIDHPDVIKNVATAAAYSLDRTQLFRLVAPQMIAPQEVWMEEEVLELKPIETLKKKLEEELSPVSSESKLAQSREMAIPEPIPTPEIIPTHQEIPEKIEELEPIPAIPYQSFASWFGRFHPPLLQDEILELPQPIAPEPIQQEESVQQEPESLNTDNQEFIDNEDDDPPVDTPSKTGGIAQILAEKSVAENKDVISETLAKLFAKQGYREKAINMYERLILAFPEKSAYFAAEIDKLKK